MGKPSHIHSSPPSLLACLGNGLTSFTGLGGGLTLKGLSLSSWQVVKKGVVSISENHALVWLALLGTRGSFDKAF